jgi:hypothetical protein
VVRGGCRWLAFAVVVATVLAGLGGVGGWLGFKSGLERVMVLVKHGAWFLKVACFRWCCGWAVLAGLAGVGGCSGVKCG